MLSPSWLASLLLMSSGVLATPMRGGINVAVGMCNVWGRPTIPSDVHGKLTKFWTDQGPGKLNMQTFLDEQSDGTVRMGNVYVLTPITIERDVLPNGINQWNGMSRGEQIKMCREQSEKKHGRVTPTTHRFSAFVYETPTTGSVTGGAPWGGTLFAYQNWCGLAFYGHEFFHSLGLPDSWSEHPPATTPSIYWDWSDTMSNMGNLNRLFIDPDPDFSWSGNAHAGPNLAAPNRDRLGWIPINRIFRTPTKMGSQLPIPISLSSISKRYRQTRNYLMARVPARDYAATDGVVARTYYTVEARTWEGFDRNLGVFGGGGINGAVVIHRVGERGHAQPVLIPNGNRVGWLPGETFQDGRGVKISVGGFNAVTGDFSVAVWTDEGDRNWGYYGPNTCKNGLVWREADMYDYVCAVPQSRDKARLDNNQYLSRSVPIAGSTWRNCRAGFVERQAWPGDRICISPMDKPLLTRQNLDAPNSIVSDYGANSIANPPLVLHVP